MTAAELTREGKMAELLAAAPAHAKRNCRTCYGKGVVTEVIGLIERGDKDGVVEVEVEVERRPVPCNCALRRIAAKRGPRG